MKRLPAPTYHFVMPFILSGVMTLIVSCISTIRAVGFQSLTEHWLGSWLWSWTIAYPILLCILPIVRWVMKYIVESPQSSDARKV